jgi:hypothetical protein
MKILKSFALIVVFFFSLLIFLPKQNIYYLAEQKLSKYDIVISNETFISDMFGFRLENAFVYVKGVNIASLDKVNVSFSGVSILSKEIGKAMTLIDIENKSLVIDFEPTKNFIREYKMVLKYFKKQKNGVYKYEYKLF